MPWRVLTAGNVLARFTPSQTSMLQTAQGSTSQFTNTLQETIQKWQGAIRAAYPRELIPTDGQTVPDQLRQHIVADAVWEWLRDFPKLAQFKTKEREDRAKDAASAFASIVERDYGEIESPTQPTPSDTIGNWNSEGKIIGRMHPVPPAALQWTQSMPVEPIYANPDAPSDTVPPASPTMPQTPLGFEVFAGNARNTLVWSAVFGASGYNIYRAVAAGGEGSTPFAQVVSGTTSYVDSGLTNGQTYFYQITATSGSLESPPTGEWASAPSGANPP